MQPLSLEGRSYDYGTLMVAVANQSIEADALHSLMQEVAQETQLNIYSVSTGLTKGN